jgi:hypothetical protein
MEPTPSPDKFNDVRALLKAGNKIAAIKEYRQITGVGLAEAKEAVESMSLDPNAPAVTNVPANAPQKGGCFGIALITGAALAAWWRVA